MCLLKITILNVLKTPNSTQPTAKYFASTSIYDQVSTIQGLIDEESRRESRILNVAKFWLNTEESVRISKKCHVLFFISFTLKKLSLSIQLHSRESNKVHLK